MTRLAIFLALAGVACAAPRGDPNEPAAQRAPLVEMASLDVEARVDALDAGCEDHVAWGEQAVLEVLPSHRELAVLRVDGVLRCVDAVPALVADLAADDGAVERLTLERYARALSQEHGTFTRPVDERTPRLADVAPRELDTVHMMRRSWSGPFRGDPFPIPVDLPWAPRDTRTSHTLRDDPFQGDPHPIPVDPLPELECEEDCAPGGEGG